MTKAELIYHEDGAALFEHGRLVEYIKNPPPNSLSVGAICLARITQLFPKQKRGQCQLPSGEVASLRLDNTQDYLSGALMWVTLTAMGRQHKPWQAESGISRAGRLIVLHHGLDEVRVSHKAKGAIDESIIAQVRAALPNGWGAVLKRASAAASAEMIQDEIAALLAPLTLPIGSGSYPDAPSCLYQGDSPQVMLSIAAPDATLRYDDEAALWDEIEDAAYEAAERDILLDNGARLSFEATQALLAVDVDSGTSKLGPLALARATAPEIMRIIRLASYSGVIVIDMPRLAFKDMAAILDEMRDLAQNDIRHPDILGVSRAGLIEMIVRHRLAPLSARLSADT